MPVQVESQGQLQEFLGVLKQRRWWVLLPALFVLALGTAVAVIIPKKYQVKTRIELREQRVEGDYQLKNPNETSSAQEIVNAEYHIKHFGRVQKLIIEGEWEDYNAIADPDPEREGAKKAEFVQGVLDDIDVAILQKNKNQGSTFVDIYYKGTNPKQAELFLNRLAKLWVTEVIDRDRAVLTQELGLVQNSLAQASSEWQQALKRENDLLLESGLSFTQKEGTKDEDPVFKRLSEAIDLRAKAETELRQVRAQIDLLKGEWEKEPSERPVLQQQAGVDLSAQIADLQAEHAKYLERQKQLKPANTEYQLLNDQIAAVEKKIANLEAKSKPGSVVPVFEANPHKQELRTQIGTLEVSESGYVAELLALDERIERDQAQHNQRVLLFGKLEELRADRAIKEAQYMEEAATERLKRSSLEMLKSAYGTPYEIAEEAKAPPDPTEPNPWVIVAFALVAGLALGLAITVFSEYSRSCYRSVADIGRVLDLPVLGLVDPIVTGSERRRSRVRALVTATSSLVLIGGLFFVTWAYARHQSYLPTDLLGAIENLRMKLR